MKPADSARAAALSERLVVFSATVRPLSGIASDARRAALVAQLVESIRRVEFVGIILNREIAPGRCDPSSTLFDPIRGAAFHAKSGNVEEAFWLVFLATHFGKPRPTATAWSRVRAVYGGLGTQGPWTWAKTSTDLSGFRKWLAEHWVEIPGKFGGHRRYESLDPDARGWTGDVVRSYVDWIMSAGSHVELLEHASEKVEADPQKLFDLLYDEMDVVLRFGRLAKFDYLTMAGKLLLANVAPSGAYLRNSTGPLNGARLLFFPGETSGHGAELELYVTALGAYLGVGMQVMEDALCNWQKSPEKFIAYRG